MSYPLTSWEKAVKDLEYEYARRALRSLRHRRVPWESRLNVPQRIRILGRHDKYQWKKIFEQLDKEGIW